MFDNLLISNIERFLGSNVKLRIMGFMQMNSNVNNLKMKLEDDSCILSGNDDFLLSFNINQVSNLDSDLDILQIYIDSDLIIIIEKT